MGKEFKINRSKILSEIVKSQMKPTVTELNSGDSVVVSQIIKEGNKSRVQKFSGTVLRVNKKGSINETFIVRKESNGIGVEKSFHYHSPLIKDVEVQSHGKTRRAYISYLRQRSGKSARIKKKKVISSSSNSK